MPFEEIKMNERTRTPPDRVSLTVKHITAKKTGRTSVVAQMDVGSAVAKMCNLNLVQAVRLERGTGQDAGKIQVLGATLGRRLQKMSHRDESTLRVSLPATQLGFTTAIPAGRRLVPHAIMPDGALVVELPVTA